MKTLPSRAESALGLATLSSQPRSETESVREARAIALPYLLSLATIRRDNALVTGARPYDAPFDQLHHAEPQFTENQPIEYQSLLLRRFRSVLPLCV